MRKFFWQRGALIFLLMTRLVIGELGHAMPVPDSGDMGAAHHHQIAVEMTEEATDPPACADHEGTNHQPAPAAHECDASSEDASSHSSGEQDCCKTGACECPCLHVPCATLDALVLNPVATALLRSPPTAEGLVSQRPSGLFRPPPDSLG